MIQAQAYLDRARLASLLATAAARARAERRSVLASLRMRAPGLDPLDTLEAVVRDSASDPLLATQVAAGRMYWTRPRDDFTLVGLGSVATFAPTGEDRFAAVDRAWTALRDGALMDDATGDAPGIDPVLMGGFGFEAETERSETWRGFPDAHLIVPRVLLAADGSDCWLTVSVMVGMDGEPDTAPEDLRRLCQLVVAALSDGAVTSHPVEPPDQDIAFTSPVDASAWQATASAAVADIRAGALQKVVLAREVHAAAPRDVDVFAMLRHLRAAHRDCFVFGYWRGDRAFVGASPERLVRVDGREVRASSLAGSATRGATPAQDAALAAELLASGKNRAEHSAVRDALRVGLAELCDDVEAAEVPTVLTLPHLHHLHTAVRATLRPGYSLLDVVARLHPTPAVGGTPRDAALRFIRDREQLDRGWYAAPIGWIGRRGGDVAVALRSAVVAGREAMLFAGCGIVAESVPALEFAESLLKLRPMQAALAAALRATPSDRAAAMSAGVERVS